jgi:hypothetical protein
MGPPLLSDRGPVTIRLYSLLSDTHLAIGLRSIVRAYRLAVDIDLDALDSVELAKLIVACVRVKLRGA